MKILITGASGFIGSFIVEAAIRQGFDTWAGVRATSSKKYLQDERIHFAQLDMRNTKKLCSQLLAYKTEMGGEGWDYIVHAAGATKCLHAEDFFRTNTDGTRNFIDAVGSDWVGAYFDTGNVVFAGYPEQWIRILGKRIRKVHFKDYRFAPGGLNCFVDLLSGDVNWPEVMKAFEEIGYDDWAAGEMIPQYKYASDQIIYNTSASMDRILNKNF